jgi:tetratricopeptide (TPR) repeat protein
MGIDESVSAGQAALQAGRWDDARAAFELDLCEQVTAEALLGMGEALWWLGEPHSSVDYHERAYAAFRRTGDTAQAAWTAMWLCLAYRSDFGNHAAASGWMARAERVLRDAEPGPMQGWLWLTHAYEAGDVERSRQFAERALEFAREADDLDLELCALGALGAALVEMGQIEKGLALVDEAMAGTLGGERSRLATVVFTSCSMLSACEIAADLERATQWCRVVDAFIRRYGCPFLHAYCRTAYGGILIATGHWEDAERELATAIRMTAEVWPAMQAQALTHLIGLRLRQGPLGGGRGAPRGARGRRRDRRSHRYDPAGTWGCTRRGSTPRAAIGTPARWRRRCGPSFGIACRGTSGSGRPRRGDGGGGPAHSHGLGAEPGAHRGTGITCGWSGSRRQG